MNEDEYIQKWIDKSVTLLEWSEMRFKLIDHWEIIDNLDLNSEEISEIFMHQLNLFEQRVGIVVKNKLEQISADYYSIDERNELIKDKLYLIDSFLKSFEVNTGLTRLLGRSVYPFSTEDYLNILESVQRVKIKIVDPDTPNNYDINRISKRSPFDHSRSYFIASVILKYQSELNKILNEKPIDEKPIDKLNTPVINPFKYKQTAEIFDYIVTNWSYTKQQKWANIFNSINDLDGYSIPYKNEYQSYIIQRFGYTGKFQYDKKATDTNRHQIELMELIKNFSKK
jgi:hypothetical protein